MPVTDAIKKQQCIALLDRPLHLPLLKGLSVREVFKVVSGNDPEICPKCRKGNRYLGEIGTKERDEYEYELRMDVLGKMIKAARQERQLTQEQLGQLVGVKKAQISKLESSANSATIDTIIKVFKALKAEINFNVKLEHDFVKLA